MGNFKLYLLGALACIALLIVVVVARYRREIRAAHQRVDGLGSRLIKTECGPVEYARVGDGYPVLVVHGDMGGFDQGLLTARPLLDAGFQVIAVSRFGYLRSPLPAGADINRQADAYACLLDALDIWQAAVFAFSAGATSSLRFAARHPGRVSALILLSPAAPGDVKVTPPPKAIFDTLMRSDFIYWATITYFGPQMRSLIGVPRGFALTPEMEAEVQEALVTTLPLSERMAGFLFDTYDPQLLSDFYASVSEASPYPLGEIETPALVINALDDPYAVPENVRGLAGRLPNARLVVVPEGGHALLGHTQEVGSEMTQFLNRLVTVPNSGQ